MVRENPTSGIAVAGNDARKALIKEQLYLYLNSMSAASSNVPNWLTSIRFHSDYINPIDLCNRLNTYIIPEAMVHAFLSFLFLINGYWIAIVLNLPLLAFNAKK